ncbi:pentapeptide repeat protein [hydrothermal vent metagenome]|uniref:Pentapeptide repeat protein n=1 Tax=hydrothermal vent metagenome TaxID=652676 RepID=A0A3B1C380_9ZZZZ
MNQTITENKVFKKINFGEKRIPRGDYDNCRFINCKFININLSGFSFIECEFEDCDLSMAKINNTSFKGVKFINCKLLGLNFNDCDNFLLMMCFDNCHLNLASFYKLELKKIEFRNCDLKEADFTETDLTNSKFENCDLNRAIFSNTKLGKADLSTSYNYSIDPEINRIRKAKFSSIGALGLLDKYDIIIEA